MNDSPNRRYDVTVTVARDGGPLPDPAAFAVAAEQAAARRASGVMSAQQAEDSRHRVDDGVVCNRNAIANR